MQLLLQIVNYDNKYSLITSNDFDKIYYGIKESTVLVDNFKMRSLLNTFVKECYCEGNFFAIPYIEGFSLNRAKGRLKKQGYQYTFVDNSDTYFKVCYNFFVSGQSICQLTKLIDLKYEVWKKRYMNNWNAFVTDNLFQGFIDSDGKPLSLWNNTCNDFAIDLENYLINAIDALSKRKFDICRGKHSGKNVCMK